MQRLLLLVAAIVWFTIPALAQDQPSPQKQPADSLAQKNLDTRPPDLIPSNQLRGYGAVQEEGDLGVLSEGLTEAQVLRRLGRLYRYQSEILAAQANQDGEHTEQVLDLAMTELGTLAQVEGIAERPRYRELYLTIVTEYERYYGVPDTVLTLPYGSIFALRSDVFALLDDVEEPLLEDVTLPALPPMRTVVPMTTNRVVERTINYFLTQKRDVLERWMARADTYFPMIEQIFQEEGVPDELKYLALVESGLNPRARSWARAVGMWQFVSATGRAYGLQVTSWVDERMDPEQATRAAARHLKDLYEMYGNNWHVAMAGYNCSPRCIKRAIRKAGGTVANPPSYWDMYRYLPRETRGYVPQFIAFAIIMSNPEAFGLANVPKGPKYAYDYVPVQGMLLLEDVARMAGTDVATIKALNPNLRRGTLPPSKSAFMLRIPLGTYEQFADAFEKLPDSAKRTASEYVVRRGDSLGKIGSKFGVSVSALKSANNLRGTLIHPGQHLVVPVPSYGGTVSLAEAKAVSVQYGMRTIRPIEPDGNLTLASAGNGTPVVNASNATPRTGNGGASASSTPKATTSKSSSETRIVYKVRRGDTLGKIARKYGVTVSDLQRWNNISGTRIKSGQRLYLYSSGPASSQPDRIVYKVRRGDTLGKIAQKYSVSVRSLRTWNSLSSTKIKVGQRLTIHPGQTAPNYVVYKVRKGDNLGKIARKYGVTVSKLKSWNGLRSNTIRPGQRLRIYS
ncbi:MAG: LysM peptidoglycan-binding domain-containing protein [Rhodothermales bacterium]